MIRRWIVYLVAFGFLAGLTACLVPHFDDHDHGSGAPSTATHPAQACATSAVPSEDQKGSPRPLLASSLDITQNLYYKGVPLAPPFPPPRA